MRMKASFDNENFLFKPYLKNQAGEEIPQADMVMIEVVFRSAFDNKEWLKFRHPTLEGWAPLREIESVKYAEITTTQAEGAPVGNIKVRQTIHVVNAKYSEGFQALTGEGLIMLMKKS